MQDRVRRVSMTLHDRTWPWDKTLVEKSFSEILPLWAENKYQWKWRRNVPKVTPFDNSKIRFFQNLRKVFKMMMIDNQSLIFERTKWFLIGCNAERRSWARFFADERHLLLWIFHQPAVSCSPERISNVAPLYFRIFSGYPWKNITWFVRKVIWLVDLCNHVNANK